MPPTLEIQIKLRKLFVFLCLLLLGTKIHGQCSFGGTNSSVVVSPTAATQQTTSITAGEYFQMNVVNGGTYTVSVCGIASWDTQLTAYTAAGVLVDYNDDFCGLQSEISFTAPITGQIRIMVNEFFCSSSANTTLVAYSGIAPSSNDPPVLTATGDQEYCPGTTIPVVETISITDPDDTTADEVAIQISSGYVNGEDTLTLTGAHPSITTIWSASEGKLTLTGPATLAEFENAISAVVFASSAASPSGSRGFSITMGDPNFLPSSGHYYEFVADPGITWTDARDAAALRTYYGLQGYLATLTSQAEADFSGSQATGVGWIGANDDTTEGDWQWVTGPEAGTSFWSGGVGGTELTFAFWNNNEPNDYPDGPSTPGQENFAHITDSSIGIPGSWNDLPNVGGGGAYAPQGYIVEFGGTAGDPVVNVSATTAITIDKTNPTASNPSTLTVNCSADVPSADVTVVTDEADNCTTNPTVTFIGDVSDGGSNPETISRTYRVTDATGNSIDVVQTITVNDTTDPVIAACPTNIVVSNDTGSCGALVTWTAPTVSDNCGAVSLTTNNYNSGDLFLPGTTTVVYTATDAAGNTDTCSFTVTVTDDEDPIVSGPSNISVNTDGSSCDAVVTYAIPTITDNCAAGDGTYPVVGEFEAADRAAMINECWQFSGTTLSTNNPLVDTKSMRTSNLISSGPRTLISPLVYLNGNGQLTFTHRIDRVRNNNRITVSLVDEAGTATTIFTEVYASNVAETEAIAITATGNYRVRFDFETNSNATDRARLDRLTIPGLKVADTSGSGACPAASFTLTQTAGLASGATFPLGTTTNTFETTDAFGNTGTYSFDVIVTDNEDPTASDPAPVTVYCTSDIPAADISVVTDEADNCTTGPTVSFVSDVSDGGSNPEIITRTYRVTDAAGNTTDVEQTITVASMTANAGSNQQICTGESVTLTANVSGGTAGYTYLWNTGQTTATITFTPAGDPTQDITIDYTVTVTDSNGCQDSDTVSVEVETIPSASVSVTDASCNLNNGAITFTFPNHPQRTGIEFSLDDQASYESTVADNSGSVTYNGLSAGSYDLWVRWGDNSCPIDLGTFSISDIPEVTANTQPTDQTVLVGNQATFTTSWNNADTYQWQESTDGGASWSNLTDDGIRYIGAGTNTLAVLGVQQADNQNQYRVLVSNSGTSCTTIISTEVELLVRVASVITNRRITYRVNKN